MPNPLQYNLEPTPASLTTGTRLSTGAFSLNHSPGEVSTFRDSFPDSLSDESPADTLHSAGWKYTYRVRIQMLPIMVISLNRQALISTAGCRKYQIRHFSRRRALPLPRRASSLSTLSVRFLHHWGNYQLLLHPYIFQWPSESSQMPAAVVLEHSDPAWVDGSGTTSA